MSCILEGTEQCLRLFDMIRVLICSRQTLYLNCCYTSFMQVQLVGQCDVDLLNCNYLLSDTFLGA